MHHELCYTLSSSRTLQNFAQQRTAEQLLNLVFLLFPTLTISGCDIGWYSIRDVCYKFESTHLSVQAAKQDCINEGGRLWEPRNGADYHAVMTVAKEVIKNWLHFYC